MTRLADQLTSEVDEAAIDAAWNAIGPKRVRARRLKRARVAAPMVVVLVALLVFGLRSLGHPPAPGPLAMAGGGAMPALFETIAPNVFPLDDGSRLELHEGARVSTKRTDGHRVVLGLERGGATFDIKPGGPRMWVVDAGDVTVRVLGTRFSVVRDASDDVHVVVERGKVLVENPRLAGGSVILVAGQSVDVHAPTASASLEPSVPVEEAGTRAPDGVVTSDELPTPPASARPSAPASTPSGAVATAAVKAAPSSTAVAAASAPVVDPMASADEARHAGRPREAVEILGKLVAQRDPQAALAAFTLGKIHADDLDDPSTAGDWFDRATKLGLPGALQEDASSRVVECYARAARKDDAKAAAIRYRESFPQGRHLERVRAWAAR